MSYPTFDRSRLRLRPLAERVHDMTLAEVLDPADPPPACDDPALPIVADRVAGAPHPRLRTFTYRRDDRERGALYPGRAVRAVAGDRPAERRDCGRRA